MKRMLVLLCLSLGLARAEAPPAEAQGLAALLPAETMFVMELDDLGGAQRWGRETALGRIWNEPEVQLFVKNLEKTITEAMAKFQQGFNPLGMIGLEAKDFDGIRVRRGGFAVIDVSMNGRAFKIDALMTLQFRDGAANAAKVFEGLRRGIETFSPLAFQEAEVSGRKVLRLDITEQMALWTMMQGDRFVMTTTKERLQQVIGALEGKNAASLATAPRFAHVRKRMAADRHGILVYADVPRIHGRATQIAANMGAGNDVEQFNMIWNKLGLDAMQAVCFADIPQGTGFRSELAITFNERRGILGFPTAGTPSHRFAKYAPKGALLYGAECLDLKATWAAVLDLVGAFDADTRRMLEDGEKAVGDHLGVSIRDDLLGALGTEWAAYVGMPPGGGLIPDIAMFATLRDRARFDKAMLTILDRMQPMAQEEGVVMRVRTADFRGTKIRFVEMAEADGDPIPVSPAWAFGEDFVVVALFPQTVKHALIEKPSLAGNEDFRTMLRSVPKNSVSNTYIDMKGLVGWLYNTAMPFAQVFQGAINKELEQYGIELNLQDLPPAGVITRHLSGMMTYTTVEDDCIRMGVVSPFGAPMIILPAAFLIGVTAGLVQTSHREAVVVERRAARRDPLREENARLRERLRRIERDIEELKKLLEEPTKRK